MPRNMSFMLTTRQARDQTKDVTRRLGWGYLEPGDFIQQAEKCQGLKKGEKIKRIHLIQVVSVRPEPLNRMIDHHAYGRKECIREGFPEMTPKQFIKMFCNHNQCDPFTVVNRIEFKYVEPATTRRSSQVVPSLYVQQLLFPETNQQQEVTHV